MHMVLTTACASAQRYTQMYTTHTFTKRVKKTTSLLGTYSVICHSLSLPLTASLLSLDISVFPSLALCHHSTKIRVSLESRSDGGVRLADRMTFIDAIR